MKNKVRLKKDFALGSNESTTQTLRVPTQQPQLLHIQFKNNVTDMDRKYLLE